MKLPLKSVFLGAASLFSITTAQLLRYSPPAKNGLTYLFADAPANSTGGQSDIFLQISGPANFSWIALGQGSEMKGSQIFVVYTNAAGDNVTLSPRLASGHSEPASESSSGASLLEGSGIENGQMTANIICKNCCSWQGGAMNLTGAGQRWIWASKTGSPVKSDSQSAHIQQHDDGSYQSFEVDLNTLPVGSTTNPFLDLANAKITDIGAGSVVYDGIAIPIHGLVMCGAFIVGFPLGALLIRLMSFRNLVWIHAGVQVVSYAATLLGLGLGVYIANKGAADINAFHPVFGILIVVALIFQPILGYIHHLQYKRHQAPTLYTHAHVWFGRVAISAGLLNGLLGCLLAEKETGIIVAYIIIAGGVWVLWILAVVFAARIKRRFWGYKDYRRTEEELTDRQGNYPVTYERL